MIVAGIDEAGYGPLLGPLVVGCCAFELADVEWTSPTQPLPCLWKRLGKVVGKTRHKTGKRLHVNDSKMVYTPAAGLRELERAILAISATRFGWADDLDAFLSHVHPELLGDLQDYAWYVPAEETFPLASDAMALRLFTNALRLEMDRTKTRCVHLAARVLTERRYNRMIDQTRNKASVLFSTGAAHIDHLLRTYGRRGLVIFCDRQGGREHYGHNLRLMFDDWRLEIVHEQDGRSEYRLHDGPHTVRVIFCEKAEAQCMPVAIASMLAKYLRESLMGRFNAYWRAHLPDVHPTAGYYTDGQRFLIDIATKRAELGIADEAIIRSR